MEIALKTGEDIVCDYSGSNAGVLVKLKPDSEGVAETGWLSRKALEDALKVISSLDGGGAPPQRHTGQHAASQPQPMVDGEEDATTPPQPRQPTSPANLEVVNNFDRELKSLIRSAEKEEPEDGKKKGVREIELRELVMKHRPVFGKNGADHMFRVMNIRVGMERNRFNILWNEKPARAVEGLEDDDD